MYGDKRHYKSPIRGRYSEELSHIITIIIIERFTERKIDIGPLMRIIPGSESPVTDMGQYRERASQGMTKLGGGILYFHRWRNIVLEEWGREIWCKRLCDGFLSYDYKFCFLRLLIPSIH